MRSLLDPHRSPRPDGRIRRRPTRRAAEQRRADPPQLLLLEHRHFPARSRALLAELRRQRAAPDHELLYRMLDQELAAFPHAVAARDVRTVEPRIPQCRDAVEAEHAAGHELAAATNSRAPPHIFGVVVARLEPSVDDPRDIG